jgi:hypothetical protein
MGKTHKIPRVLKQAKKTSKIACSNPWDKGHWSNRKSK